MTPNVSKTYYPHWTKCLSGFKSYQVASRGLRGLLEAPSIVAWEPRTALGGPLQAPGRPYIGPMISKGIIGMFSHWTG